MEWLIIPPLFVLYCVFGLFLFAFAAYVADEWFGVHSPRVGSDLDTPGFCAFIALLWPFVIGLMALIGGVYLGVCLIGLIFHAWKKTSLPPYAFYNWLCKKWGRK